MSGSGKGSEPSMDEILASIKKIISEEPARSEKVVGGEGAASEAIDASLDELFKVLPGAGREAAQVSQGNVAGSVQHPTSGPTSNHEMGVNGAVNGGMRVPTPVAAPERAGASGETQQGIGHSPPVDLQAPGAAASGAGVGAKQGGPAAAGGSAHRPNGQVAASQVAASQGATSEVLEPSALETIRLRARQAAGLLRRTGDGESAGRFAGPAAPNQHEIEETAPSAAPDARGQTEAAPVLAPNGVRSNGVAPGAGVANGVAAHAAAGGVASRPGAGTSGVQPGPHSGGATDEAGGAQSQAPAARDKASPPVDMSSEAMGTASSSRSLEDAVSEMLRPMLAAWLDAHLPKIIDRVVREELAKRSGPGARGGA